MDELREIYTRHNGCDILLLISKIVLEDASDELKKEYPDKIPFDKLYTDNEIKLRKKVQILGQYDAEQRTAVEMKKKNILPISFLTIENLKKWIEDEGKPYTEIARNTGNSASYVGEVAKKFNILSRGSKIYIQSKLEDK